MRILTVRQPWAWAIIHGGKTVENRPRNIAGGYRGPVAIHAGLEVDTAALTSLNVVGAVALTRIFKGAGHPSTFKRSPTGAIIGVVDLVDVHMVKQWTGMSNVCFDDHTPVGAICSPWAQNYLEFPRHEGYHLVFENPRPLAEPIPYTGALGLRDLAVRDPETVLAITRQIGRTP